MKNIDDILKENGRRQNEINRAFDPLTGENSIGKRFRFALPDFSIPVQFLPVSMKKIKLIRELIKYGSIEKFIANDTELAFQKDAFTRTSEKIVALRDKHDFPFHCIFAVKIKSKKGGKNIPFRFNRPQRRLVEKLEEMRLAGKPIRLILLKARQWGGSTCVQMYIAWIQLVHKEGWYSAIVAQDSGTSKKIRAMYSKMLADYPPFLLGADEDAAFELTPYEGSHNDTIITSKREIVRDTVICVGTAERPNSIRGGDISCTHMSEVAFWKATDGKTPEEIIRSVSSSILMEPYTVDIIESTANGTGNLFHTEWCLAKDGDSDREALFIAWYDIEMYSKPLTDIEEFAQWLYDNRNNEVETVKSESGKYLWSLWEDGATLEAINWYVHKRKSFNCHADMAAEFPSNDIEAFKHSGRRAFDNFKVNELRMKCKNRPFKWGDIYGNGISGKQALENLTFTEDKQGVLKMFELPDRSETVSNRYLVIVDVGGRGNKADYSDILVIDRYWMMLGLKPKVVAEWHGHIDHDLLAWKAAQVAKFYCNALLVIESNTLETKDKERDVDGDNTEYILNEIKREYDNLYSRTPADKIREGAPAVYGFHTNISTKPMIISHLVKMIRNLAWIEMEPEACDEFDTYEKKQNGSYGAIQGKHDDRVMVRAIGLYICFFEMPLPKVIEEDVKIAVSVRAKSAATI